MLGMMPNPVILNLNLSVNIASFYDQEQEVTSLPFQGDKN